MYDLIIKAVIETITMVSVSFVIGVMLGVPLALTLYNLSERGLKQNYYLYALLQFIINSFRSLPYIVLVIILIPLSRLIIGSTIGVYAAIVPLGLASVLLVAKSVEESLKTVPSSLVEVGVAMGASNLQIMSKILIAEAMPNIIANLTSIIINLIGFSAMAGVVGGGGLGDLAIRYGYQRYDLTMLLTVVVILILFVQFVQSAGNRLFNNICKKKNM